MDRALQIVSIIVSVVLDPDFDASQGRWSGRFAR